jgi:hypothetical protein
LRHHKQICALIIALLLPALSSFGADTKNGAGKRQLVFPKEFSCGQLYIYTKTPGEAFWPDAESVKLRGHPFGEARGTLNVPSGAGLYLIGSYDLVEHADVLNKLSPDALDCLSFGKIGAMIDLEPVIEPLSHLTGLQRLEFNTAELSDTALIKLRALVNLESLTLTICNINGTCFQKLDTLTKLKDLNLSNNKLDPSTYSCISNYPNLENLVLSHCGFADADIIPLLKLKRLKHLRLERSLITGKALAQMKNFKSLADLALGGSKLSVDELCRLEGSKILLLALPEGSYSTTDLTRLKQALPSTQLFFAHHGSPMNPYTFFAPLH